MSSEDILRQPQPNPDKRAAYGPDPSQFVEVRLPRNKTAAAVVLNLHGGFWRAKYDLAHAGHLCEALRKAGLATFNVEYRRVGNRGGGWPGTFADVRMAYRYVHQQATRFGVDGQRLVVMGHSAGGQLALCLAAHEPSIRRVISLAGVVDLRRAFELRLSHDAVAEFLGGTPKRVPKHYAQADPMELSIAHARQYLLHGTDDDTVPVDFSRNYVQRKQQMGEAAKLIELSKCGHFDLIDPRSQAFRRVTETVLASVA